MSEHIEVLDENDVIDLSQKFKGQFTSGNTLKIQQLLEEYKQYIYRTKGSNNSTAKIFDDSVECEVLRHDGEHEGWRKGKIKFVVQFEPDEADNEHDANSLDDIRQQLDSTN